MYRVGSPAPAPPRPALCVLQRITALGGSNRQPQRFRFLNGPDGPVPAPPTLPSIDVLFNLAFMAVTMRPSSEKAAGTHLRGRRSSGSRHASGSDLAEEQPLERPNRIAGEGDASDAFYSEL